MRLADQPKAKPPKLKKGQNQQRRKVRTVDPWGKQREQEKS